MDMTTRFATSLMHMTLDRSQRISEPNFKSPTKNAMGRVKNEVDFHAYAAALFKCEGAVFKSMDTVLTEYMLLMNFSTDAIQDYLYGYGLLPKISRDMFRFFS